MGQGRLRLTLCHRFSSGIIFTDTEPWIILHPTQISLGIYHQYFPTNRIVIVSIGILHDCEYYHLPHNANRPDNKADKYVSLAPYCYTRYVFPPLKSLSECCIYYMNPPNNLFGDCFKSNLCLLFINLRSV